MTIASLPAEGLIPWRKPGEPPELGLPSWVREHVDESLAETVAKTHSRTVNLGQSRGHCLVTARVRRAEMLGPLELQRETIDAYRCISAVLRERSAWPIRLWNFIPTIGGRLGDSLRYMVFNAGRFAAYHEWFGGADSFDSRVPTATGVGHEAEDLLIHALGSDRPCVHIMNPRQRAPRCYSAAYGAFPPCFARATLVETGTPGACNLLIGGTAAVRGETSVAPDDLEGQTVETFRNLAELVRTAECQIASLGSPGPRHVDPSGKPCEAPPRRHAERSEASPARYSSKVLEILRCAQNDVSRGERRSEQPQSGGSARGEDSARRDVQLGIGALGGSWSSFRSLRVYIRRPTDEPAIRNLVARRFPHLAEIEFVKADICRPELLVEIEGTALIGGKAEP